MIELLELKLARSLKVHLRRRYDTPGSTVAEQEDSNTPLAFSNQ